MINKDTEIVTITGNNPHLFLQCVLSKQIFLILADVYNTYTLTMGKRPPNQHIGGALITDHCRESAVHMLTLFPT